MYTAMLQFVSVHNCAVQFSHYLTLSNIDGCLLLVDMATNTGNI